MNLRTIFISSFLSLGSLGVLAQEQINLSGTWQFAFAANQKEADRLERFYMPDFAKSKFKSTPVPSNWALLGYEEPVYRGFKDNQAGEGFYVREFTIPQDWKDKRILLHFGGVWSSAEVWLNGNELGRHDCGYTSFAFDVTNKLKVDEPNKLAVRVRQITREYKFDVCDDWTWGGIYRDVTLEAMPAKRWIDDVVVQTTFDHLFQDANLDIRVMISDKHKNTLPGNYPSPGEPYKLCFTLTDKEGKEVAQRQMTVPAHVSTDREICLSLPVEAPHQWTAETPNDETGAWDISQANRETVDYGSDKYQNSLVSWTGRVSYAYNDRYLLTATARYDGSSRFGANNKWGFFPSVGLAWRASQENFLVDNKYITNLKIRTSFGVTGNQEIGNYKSLAQLNADNYIYNNGELQGYYESIGNPDLKWERANQFDIGVDLSLWNRLHITADYYYRKTSDLLYQVPIPSTSGFSSMLSNVGSVLNKGYELSITGNIINTNDLKIDATVNLSRNINKVKELYNDVESITLSSGLGLSRYLKVGESLNSRYALLSDGIIRTEEQLNEYRKIEGTAKLGDEMYKDLDGDNQITAKDQVNIGTTDPKLIYGVGLNVQYKKFSLNILGNGAHDFVGGTSYLQIAENQINSSVICMPSLYAYERMWSESNPSGTYPAPGASNIHESDRINSGWNYFVVKSIALSYDFGKNPIKGIKGIKSLSATVNFQNFITFSNQRGYNPENGDIKYPWVKIVNIGVNAKF